MTCPTEAHRAIQRTPLPSCRPPTLNTRPKCCTWNWGWSLSPLFFFLKKHIFMGIPQWSRLSAFTARAQVQSLVGELRSCKPVWWKKSQPTKQKTTKKREKANFYQAHCYPIAHAQNYDSVSTLRKPRGENRDPLWTPYIWTITVP